MPAEDGTDVAIEAGVLYPFTGVLLSPLIAAAAAMALSSISVVVNSTRLNAFTPPRVASAEPYPQEDAERQQSGTASRSR